MADFDTKLDPENEAKYQAWRGKLPENLRNEGDYDLRGAFLGGATEAANGHLPDTFKKPNHPTFSIESKYSTPENPGGQWMDAGDGKYVFWASPANLAYRSPQDLTDYFNRVEKDSTLILPGDFQLTPGK